MKARKEVTLAVIIGLIIALIIAGGIYRAKTAIESFDPKSLLPTKVADQSNNPDQSSEKKLFLELTSADNAVVDTSAYTVEGITLPGTYIAITSDANDYLIVPSETGAFRQQITLIKGANTITVAVFTSSGDKVEDKLSVVYTTAEL